MARHEPKSKDGDQCKKAGKRGGGNIPLQCKSIQERDTIGNDQPDHESHAQTNAGVNAGSNRRIAEDVEPTVTGKMCAHGHRMLSSPDTDNGLTRVYDGGCVTSTPTGALGALSFPARSTAVTIYQSRSPACPAVPQTAHHRNHST